MPPQIVTGENEKRAAFRIARAALAKSGTVTLELALSGVPMVTAYRVGGMEAFILRRAIRVSSVILANLVIGKDVIPSSCRRTAHRKISRARCGRCCRIRPSAGSQPMLSASSMPSCRPAISRRASAPPTSCWRRCGKQRAQFNAVIRAPRETTMVRNCASEKLEIRFALCAPRNDGTLMVCSRHTKTAPIRMTAPFPTLLIWRAYFRLAISTYSRLATPV